MDELARLAGVGFAVVRLAVELVVAASLPLAVLGLAPDSFGLSVVLGVPAFDARRRRLVDLVLLVARRAALAVARGVAVVIDAVELLTLGQGRDAATPDRVERIRRAGVLGPGERAGRGVERDPTGVRPAALLAGKALIPLVIDLRRAEGRRGNQLRRRSIGRTQRVFHSGTQSVLLWSRAMTSTTSFGGCS